MPHLRDPESSFNIGLTDPTFKTDGPLIFYRGEVTVRYIGDEQRNDALSRKYRIDGPGLKNRGGFIWVNKAGAYIEDIEIDLPDNPNWQSFKLRLHKNRTASAAPVTVASLLRVAGETEDCPPPVPQCGTGGSAHGGKTGEGALREAWAGLDGPWTSAG